MKKLIRYVISPIIFLVFDILVEYLVNGTVDLKMAITTAVMYAILNTVFYMLFERKLKM